MGCHAQTLKKNINLQYQIVSVGCPLCSLHGACTHIGILRCFVSLFKEGQNLNMFPFFQWLLYHWFQTYDHLLYKQGYEYVILICILHKSHCTLRVQSNEYKVQFMFKCLVSLKACKMQNGLFLECRFLNAVQRLVCIYACSKPLLILLLAAVNGPHVLLGPLTAASQ